MSGLFIHGSYESKVIEIVEKGFISHNGKKDPEPIASQLPGTENIPIAFCSYYCKGYDDSYGHEGVIFEPLSPLIYVSPVDNFEFSREGIWIPGVERFMFKSVEEMLKKYPDQGEFREDFRKYFQSLKAEEIFPPGLFTGSSDVKKRTDYCNFERWINLLGCNEVGFKAPLKIRLIDTFYSKEELHEKAKRIIG